MVAYKLWCEGGESTIGTLYRVCRQCVIPWSSLSVSRRGFNSGIQYKIDCCAKWIELRKERPIAG